MRLVKWAVLLTSAICAASAQPTLTSIVNAASYAKATVAPGSLASIFGSGLAASAMAASAFPLPVSLGGVSVYVNGEIAPLLYVSPGQVNFQVPFDIPVGPTQVVII